MIAIVALAACALVLTASSIAHLRRPRTLARALAVHGIVPPFAWWPLTAAVVAVEVVLAVVLVAATLVATGALGRPAAGAAAVVFLAFAGYLGAVLRGATPGARIPCGCGLGDTVVTGAVLVRAVALAAVAIAAAVAAPAEPLLTRPAEQQVLLAVAAVALAVVLVRLPAAWRRQASATRP